MYYIEWKKYIPLRSPEKGQFNARRYNDKRICVLFVNVP